MKLTIKNLDGSLNSKTIDEPKVIEFLSNLLEKYPNTTKPFMGSKLIEEKKNESNN